ncbi:MAG TPA: RnfABCDGE type electron transport complex subunit G [Proteobacteria bacterium]|nr:electron transport complex protein RnfG [bacterium BMS3Abin14]HDL52809.1 RnfABCDGE type electron transport complex subunit G [Pseudomonadota bacterium]
MKTGMVRLVVVLGTICLVAALILATVYKVTKAPIAYQMKLEVIRSLQAVLPGMEIDPDSQYIDLPWNKDQTVRVYRASGAGGITGVAFQVIAPDGYSGNILIMMGVLPDGSLGGIEILAHAETPGLGARIVEPSFKDQFKGRSLENTNFKVKKDGGDIDQLTGATISPRAVVGAVRRGLVWFKKNREKVLSNAEGTS